MGRSRHSLESTAARAAWWSCAYFGGLRIEETAEVLRVSVDTVKRDWRMARAWLLAELSR
jgi:DNA-directed RNA polymerase specialized sigma24 family protein